MQLWQNTWMMFTSGLLTPPSAADISTYDNGIYLIFTYYLVSILSLLDLKHLPLFF